MDQISSSKGLFDQLSFAIVRSASLCDKVAVELTQKLTLHGGEVKIDLYPETNLDLAGITHIVSTTSDFPDYHKAVDKLIPVIFPQWIESSLAKDKLVHTRQFNPDPRLFMSEVVVCCADLPEGDADAIAGGIIAMGGNFTTKFTGLVTHIVALTMDNDICEIALARNMNVKIVLPHWFDDCLKIGHKIDEQPYQLPDPEILQSGHTKAPLGGHKSPQVTGALNPHPDHEKPQPSQRRPIRVFKGKKFMLSDDLGIGSHLRGIVDGMIIASDGQVVYNLETADYFVCKYREGRNYKTASRMGVEVGNLAWLYYLIMHDAWTSPTRRLLHYPIPRHGIPGFKNKKISLSNYSGEARSYLENLINAAGAQCTKTLRQENTHLITAHDQSEKCAAARDWNVHMINHLWLEESYAKSQMQGESVPRYTHFPKRTNLGDVVGQTQIDRQVLRSFWADDDTEMNDPPPAEEPAQNAKASDGEKTNAVPKEIEVKIQPKRATKVKSLQNGSGNNAVEADDLKTPTANRNVDVGKENVTPLTTGSRKSKEAAAARLTDMTTDIALYEKEKKRVGGVVYGGRRKGNEKETKQSRKRTSDALDSDESDEVEHKKPRQGPAPITIHLLISGYKKWVNSPKQEDADCKKLRELGIMIVFDPAKATHLAMPQILRTAKAVVAFAYALTVISTDFIDDSLAGDSPLDPEDYLLKDDFNEERFGVSLKVSRERAKENKHQLLLGRSVYVVDKLIGGFVTYQAIVEANGGQCMTYRGRRGTMVPSGRADGESGNDNDPSNEVYLLSGDSKEDRKLWPQFAKMAEGSRKVPRIVRTDWLLDSAMCQKIQATAPYEL